MGEKVYSELSSEAQEKAMVWYRTAAPYEVDEYSACIEDIASAIGVCSYLQGGYKIKPYYTTSEVRGFKGIRALTYIYNQFIKPYMRASFLGKVAGREYYSKIACTFHITGLWLDHCILNAYDAMQMRLQRGQAITVEDFAELVAYNLEKAIEAEYDYENSAAYIEEQIVSNEYEFLSNGEPVYKN